MRILHYLSSLEPSGAARSGVLLARGLAARGHSCAVITGAPGPLAGELQEGGVAVAELPPLRHRFDRSRIRAFAAALDGRQLSGEPPPDLVHFNNLSLEGPALARAAARRGVPVVWHVREDLASSRARRLRRALLNRASIVVAVSQEIHDGLASNGEDTRICVVRNGIEPGIPADPAAARADCGLDPGACWIGWVGRVVERKGALDFLEAMGRVQPAARPLRFVLAGRPGQGKREERYAQEVSARLAARPIHLRIEHPETLPRLVEGLDILVVPSYWEGCSRVVLEGMRAGRAIVAYASGGTPELLEDGRSGLLVKTGDVAGLAASVQSLVADPALTGKLGCGARSRVEREFSLQCHLDEMERVFKTCPTVWQLGTP